MIKFNSKKNFEFWKNQAKKIAWRKYPKIIYNTKNNKPEWFKDGLIDTSYNFLEKNIKKGLSDKIAIYAIDKSNNLTSFNYKDLLKCVINLAYFIKKNFSTNHNIKKIMIHSSASLESAVSMLSCCRLGITHNVIFEDLESEAVYKRLIIFKPDLIISNTSINKFKKTILPAVKKYNLDKNNKKNKNLKIIFYSDIKINNKDVVNLKFSYLLNDIQEDSEIASSKIVDSNHSLFALFTSGSTGEPKGIVHSTGAYLTYIKFSCKNHFGYKQNSIIMTASDAGWINGHTYALFGPLLFGATTILLSNPMQLLDDKIFSKIVYDLKPTIFYLPVTLIRILKSLNFSKKIKKPCIQTLGSMGEPLAPDVAEWYANYFSLKNKAIVNTYFQTETGGIISSPLYNEKKIDSPHGTVGKPNSKLGVFIDNKGAIKIKHPWPGCMKDVLNGNKVWKKYWDKNNNFNLFDTGSYDNLNNIIIEGRSDDVMTIRGHRIGSAEIESLLLSIENIVEVCAVSYDDYLEGSIIILFLVLKKNLKSSEDKIRKILIENFGSYAIPKHIISLNQLPKTKSGKILRSLIRSILKNKQKIISKDISTINDKNIINDLILEIKKLKLN